jgi:hypothetical protein
MCPILIAHATGKGKGEYAALGLQQRASGLVVKTKRYHIPL